MRDGPRHGSGAEAADDRPSITTLEGTIDRVTFQNEENGYTIARLIPDGRSGTVTIVGNLLGAQVGASFRLRGRWITHATFGKQFAVEDFKERLPATVEGIRKYLGSGLIKGVGPVTADKIVDFFGLETLDIIDTAAERLGEVPGVGPVRAKMIVTAWAEQRQIKEIMLFLQSHDVTTGLAVRIYKTYGDEAIRIVRDEPYRMSLDPREGGVFGIGFTIADRIARRLGLAPDDPRRIEAGLRYALGQLSDDGHTFAPRPVLVETTAGLLTVDEVLIEPSAVEAGIDRLVEAEALVSEAVPTSAVSLASNKAPSASDRDAEAESVQALYLPPFYFAEVGIANGIRRIIDDPGDRLLAWAETDWPATYTWLDGMNPYPLAERQREAVRSALTRKVSILTGGPGTGKTTTVRSILQLLRMRRGSVMLAAPTGRAAKRLAETSGVEAKTIHRLLEFKPMEGKLFQRDRDNPIDADLVVVDEMSMVDTQLMNSLVKAIDSQTHLLLVGDTDQLPSVGAGNVLRDLNSSGVVPTIELDQVFRQDARSHIISNAHRINRGAMPVLDPKTSDDFFLFAVEDAAAAADMLVDVVVNRVPRRFGLDPVADVQVLTPMHRGKAGVAELNSRLQAELNPPAPSKPEVRWGGRTFRLGDKVMQIRNDYDKDVFNGDLGLIETIDAVEQNVVIDFVGTSVPYEFHELDELVHAFACSVHKSQGAEYRCVVMTVLPSHWMMLQRNLLYTGVTRAKELCVLVGSKRAIGQAVRNDTVAARNTGLARRLSEGGAPTG